MGLFNEENAFEELYDALRDHAPYMDMPIQDGHFDPTSCTCCRLRFAAEQARRALGDDVEGCSFATASCLNQEGDSS